VVIAASTTPAFLAEAVAILAAAAAIAYLSFRAGLLPIVGFLLAGVAIGPHALGLVRDPALVDAVAEAGVILLMFTIGIEFSLERLAQIERLIFVGGGLQVALSCLVTVGLLAVAGVDWHVGLFTGFLVSLSSTAIVLKVLSDRGDSTTRYGQASLGLLIFQDLAIIVMVLLVPMLGGGSASVGGAVFAIAKAVGIILLVLLLARRLMPPVLERVALTCSPELFLLAVVAICFGTAWLTSIAGVSVSLGAFLAGLLVSESRFRHHALGEIMPLQILFSATFFVSVGMLLDGAFVLRHPLLVIGAVAVVLLVKVCTTAIAVLALRYPLSVAAATGLTLAQVGEFSFVLDRAGDAVGLTPAGLGAAGSQSLIAATVLLMVGTPRLAAIGAGLAARLERHGALKAIAQRPGGDRAAADEFAHLADHVIVAGYGDAARQLVRVLHGSRIPFVIVTLSPGGANEAEAEGLQVLRGDATRHHTLTLAGIERAKIVVIADDDPPVATRIAATARALAPTARVLVRTRYHADAEPLTAEGADLVIADELESVVQLFGEVLRNYEIASEQIDDYERTIRSAGYTALQKNEPGTPFVCDVDDECMHTRRVPVRAGAAVNGQPLLAATAGLLSGLTIREVERGGVVMNKTDLVLETGDLITAAGTAAAFAGAASAFRASANVVAASGHGPGRGAASGHADEIVFEPSEDAGCTHLDAIHPVRPSAHGCEDCLRIGGRWVHLRICLTCGHVGCCDSSPNRHATAHFHATGHPIIRSMERGETWGWCYIDEVML
jgi:CPA2 family monovalent cation:H+ antiporter-2